VSAGTAVAALVASAPVRDLSLVEPDIEDVVARLYGSTAPVSGAP
jgi:ABC-2 type transport system ATP-binding protein